MNITLHITKSIVLAGAEWLDMIHVADPYYLGKVFVELNSCPTSRLLFACFDKSTLNFLLCFFVVVNGCN